MKCHDQTDAECQKNISGNWTRDLTFPSRNASYTTDLRLAHGNGLSPRLNFPRRTDPTKILRWVTLPIDVSGSSMSSRSTKTRTGLKPQSRPKIYAPPGVISCGIRTSGHSPCSIHALRQFTRSINPCSALWGSHLQPGFSHQRQATTWSLVPTCCCNKSYCCSAIPW